MSTSIVAARGLRVAELAQLAGVSPDTIRYYERVGLLPPPGRTRSGYRHFGAESVDRLRFIQGCQRLGLRLADIADLLAVRDSGACACEPAAPLLRRRIGEIDAEMVRLAALRADMVAMLAALPAPECPPLPGVTSWRPPTAEHETRGGGER